MRRHESKPLIHARDPVDVGSAIADHRGFGSQAWTLRALSAMSVFAIVLPAAAGDADTVRIVAPGVGEAVAFYLFAGVAVVSCIGIAVSGNIVRMAVWLFATLASVSALYFLLAANLLAAIQLIVYVGGTLVLIIFGVMLTSKSPWARFDVSRRELLASAAVCTVLFISLAWVTTTGMPTADQPQMERSASVAEIGEALLTTYLLPFEVASVLLLAVMIGAAYLARPEKE